MRPNSDVSPGDIDERDKVLQEMNSEVEKLEKDNDDKEELIKQLEEDLERQDHELEKQDVVSFRGLIS